MSIGRRTMKLMLYGHKEVRHCRVGIHTDYIHPSISYDMDAYEDMEFGDIAYRTAYSNVRRDRDGTRKRET